MLLVDSDTWIFYLDASLPEHARVGPRLEAILEEQEVLLTTAIQVEVAHYVVRRMGEAADRALRVFFDYPAEIEALDPEDVAPSVELLRDLAREGIGGRDATLLHAARKRGAEALCTSDRGLARAARRLGIGARDLAGKGR